MRWNTLTSLRRVCVSGQSLCKKPSLGNKMFSVKELSWCAPSDSPNRTKGKIKLDKEQEENFPTPVERFGIVAAMSRNRVIGVDGKLPWSVPQDRKLFTQLTRDKVLIVGRKTFEERPNQTHVKHVRHVIIVSSTQDKLESSVVNTTIARSFQEALGIAKSFADEVDGKNIDCWIGGGQQIYEQALSHPSATELHLSVIDTVVELSSTVSMFPAKYRWDHKFHEVSKSERERFTYFVYNRNER